MFKGKTEKELQTAKLTESDTPEVVDEELIEEKGHVNRLWEQENDLNTIVFQNKNGSKTMYIYAAPVKYKDETGKVKDKKNKLSEQDIEPQLAEDYGLTNPENDVRTYVFVALPIVNGKAERVVKEGFTKLDNLDELFDASKKSIKTIKHAVSSGVKIVSNPNKTVTILGRYEEDMQHIIKELSYPESFNLEGKPGYFNILNIPKEVADNMSRDQFWHDFNIPFLDKALERGDDIVLATPAINKHLFLNPKDPLSERTGFGKEIEYLEQHGYHLNADKTALIKD